MAKQEKVNVIDTLFILDEETKFLAKKLDKAKCHVIVSSAELSSLLNNKFQAENIVIFVELYWGTPISQFYGYEVAKELMNSPNRLSKFNLLFISTLSRETLYKINGNNSRVFTKSFQHKHIDSSFSLEKLQVALISDRKFDYLRRYCLTQTGILEKLEHDLRPGKSLSASQIDDLILQIKANADLVGLKVLSILNEINPDNFHSKRVYLYEQLVNRIKEIAKNRNFVTNGNKKAIWKPLMLLIEDDENQRTAIDNAFSPYFTLASVGNGLEARKYIQSHSEQISVVLCDMELLDKNYLDGDIQGIDIIEYIKEHHPHIVLKAASHLPRTGLKMMLGKMLDISDLLYKSMLLDANADFIADLAKEIQSEIDLKRTFQKLRGPKGSIWANVTKDGKEGGRLKQRYYEIRNTNPAEFKQMWEEIDLEVQAVLEKKSQINTKFESTDDRKKISKLSLNKALHHLQGLLINRMFWIKILYANQEKEEINFNDYKAYFIDDFMLFGKSGKRFSNYAILTGFSFSKNPDGGHFFIFNEFLEEELKRKTANKSAKSFDLTNTYLPDDIYDILEIIAQAGGQASLTREKYSTCEKFWNENNKINLIIKTFEQLAEEKPSADLKSSTLGGSREKIVSLLSGVMNRQEYKSYPDNIKNLIQDALNNMKQKVNSKDYG